MNPSASLPPPSRRRRPRPSNLALAVVGGLAVTLAGTLAGAALSPEEDAARMARNQALVVALELTDLCLFTEARYTRHLTQADLHTPFQDAPFSLDHFPSGSVVPPPPGITRHAPMD